MKRRAFLKTVSLGAAGFTLPRFSFAVESSADGWTTVLVTARVEIPAADAPAQVWLPVPLSGVSYQELLSTEWSGAPTNAEIWRDSTYQADVFYAVADENTALDFEVTHRVRLRDRVGVEAASPLAAPLYLRPTEHVPTDGLVRETARRITGFEANPDRKARKIYDWIVDNTFRDPKVRGCGAGDVVGMLRTGNFGGKCADISSLFVGLCRAAGVPAREIFGLRVLPSRISNSLGKAGEVSGAQHCRAEFYSKAAGGWMPVDPADVRKAILEEKIDVASDRAAGLREQLFGAWEMNWIGFNAARDFELPGYGEPLNYLMYPLLKTNAGVRDGREPGEFKYRIHARAES